MTPSSIKDNDPVQYTKVVVEISLDVIHTEHFISKIKSCILYLFQYVQIISFFKGIPNITNFKCGLISFNFS